MLTMVFGLSLFLADPKSDAWFEAARLGDVATIKKMLDAKTPVDSKTAYGATALIFAADKGHTATVKLLLENKAAVNSKDTFYQGDALLWAAYRGHAEIVRILLAAGAKGIDGAFTYAVAANRTEVMRVLLESKKVNQATLDATLMQVDPKEKDLIAALKKAGAKTEAASKIKVDAKTLESYVGTYRSKEGMEVRLGVKNGTLEASFEGLPGQVLQAESETSFKLGAGFGASFVFDKPNGKPAAVVKMKSLLSERAFDRVAKTETAVVVVKSPEDTATVSTPLPWPGFRGNAASGVADGQHPPVNWNAKENQNLAWKTEIPGLGLSCPTVWGDRVFVTTAIGDSKKSALKSGQYGDVEPVEDDSKHTFKLFCIDAGSGKIRWERIAIERVPAVKRHPKSSHANPTPATDGEFVIASFASEGVFAYDVNGKLLWKKDLGKLDSGWFYDPAYQWGFASSPILFGDLVILQVDIQKGSYIAAFDKRTGKEVWKTNRDEIPSWGSPSVLRVGDRDELVTNATKFARAYDPRTGTEFWRIGKNSEITVPTPFVAAGLVFIASGYTPIRPIYAIKPNAKGDISLKAGQKTSDAVAWSEITTGPYMPTPVGYGDMLYVCANNGTVGCYDAKSGKLHYRKRLPGATSGCTASPVAADGRVYFTTEDGDTLVVKTGKEYQLLARNAIGETCLASPAISNGTFFLRGQRHLFALRSQPAATQRTERSN